MIRKVLESFTPEHPRYSELLKTLQRTIVGHAWFEDAIFLPAFDREPLLLRRFVNEISEEHKDLDQLLKLLRATPLGRKKEHEFFGRQLRTILECHLKKEEDALFPLCERVLDNEGLNRLGQEMENRKTEIRSVVDQLG